MPSSMSRPTTSHHEIRLWASAHKAMPAEILPGLVDGEPAHMHFFIPGDSSAGQPQLRIITWEDFFAGFDAHGLSFTHELLPGGGGPGRKFELLQIDERSPRQKPPKALRDSDTAPSLVP